MVFFIIGHFIFVRQNCTFTISSKSTKPYKKIATNSSFTLRILCLFKLNGNSFVCFVWNRILKLLL